MTPLHPLIKAALKKSDGHPERHSRRSTAPPFPTLVRISIKLAPQGGVLRLVCGQGRVRDASRSRRLVEAIPTFRIRVGRLQNFG